MIHDSVQGRSTYDCRQHRLLIKGCELVSRGTNQAKQAGARLVPSDKPRDRQGGRGPLPAGHTAAMGVRQLFVEKLSSRSQRFSFVMLYKAGILKFVKQAAAITRAGKRQLVGLYEQGSPALIRLKLPSRVPAPPRPPVASFPKPSQ